MSAGWIGRARVEELATRMGVAGDLDDLALRTEIDGVVAGEGIRLQIPLEAGEEPLRTVTLVVGREVEDGVRLRAGAGVDPDAALPGAVACLVLHRQHRVVGVNHLRGQSE